MNISRTKMAPKWERVARDAEARGLRVVRPTDVRIIVFAGGPGSSGLVLCEDGTAYRSDVDLSVATKIRTEADARKVLGLT